MPFASVTADRDNEIMSIYSVSVYLGFWGIEHTSLCFGQEDGKRMCVIR